MTFLHLPPSTKKRKKNGTETDNFTFILCLQDGNIALQLRPSHTGCVTIKVVIAWISVDNCLLIGFLSLKTEVSPLVTFCSIAEMMAGLQQSWRRPGSPAVTENRLSGREREIMEYTLKITAVPLYGSTLHL